MLAISYASKVAKLQNIFTRDLPGIAWLPEAEPLVISQLKEILNHSGLSDSEKLSTCHSYLQAHIKPLPKKPSFWKAATGTKKSGITLQQEAILQTWINILASDNYQDIFKPAILEFNHFSEADLAKLDEIATRPILPSEKFQPLYDALVAILRRHPYRAVLSVRLPPTPVNIYVRDEFIASLIEDAHFDDLSNLDLILQTQRLLDSLNKPLASYETYDTAKSRLNYLLNMACHHHAMPEIIALLLWSEASPHGTLGNLHYQTFSAICWAAAFDDVSLMNLLQNYGASLKTQFRFSSIHVSPVHCAIAFQAENALLSILTQHPSMVRKLYPGRKYDSLDDDYSAARSCLLMETCRYGTPNMVRQLIDMRAIAIVNYHDNMTCEWPRGIPIPADKGSIYSPYAYALERADKHSPHIIKLLYERGLSIKSFNVFHYIYRIFYNDRAYGYVYENPRLKESLSLLLCYKIQSIPSQQSHRFNLTPSRPSLKSDDIPVILTTLMEKACSSIPNTFSTIRNYKQHSQVCVQVILALMEAGAEPPVHSQYKNHPTQFKVSLMHELAWQRRKYAVLFMESHHKQSADLTSHTERDDVVHDPLIPTLT